MSRTAALLFAAALTVTSSHGVAQPQPVAGARTASSTTESSPAFRRRTVDIVQLLEGKKKPEQIFSPEFLAQASPTKIRMLVRMLRLKRGKVKVVRRVEPQTPDRGVVFVEFEKGQMRLDLSVDPKPPHLVRGLLVRPAV